MTKELAHNEKLLAKMQRDLAELDAADMKPSQKEAKRLVIEGKVARLEDKIEAGHERDVMDAEAQAQLASAAGAWLDERQKFYFLQKQDCFVERLSDGDFEMFTRESTCIYYTELRSKDFYDAVLLEMSNRGLKFKDVTYSFRDRGPDYLNLMSRADWLKPAEDTTPCHPFAFDALMCSLGGGVPENMEHLEHVLTYKYLHPEEFMLPALVIFGEGSVGKNLLVDEVLATIYGPRQTVSARVEDVLGNFNSTIKARTVAMMNEAIAEKTDMERVKDLVHKKYMTVNEKYVAAYEVDNTPLYILGGNSIDSAVRLGGDASDRRWSILKVEPDETLAYWIAEHEGSTVEQAELWLKTNYQSIYSNPVEVARWLRDIIAAHGAKPIPNALHGKHFNDLTKLQASIDQRIIAATFNDPSFTHIEKRTLYDGYKLLLGEYGHVRFKISDQKFYARVTAWLTKHAPHIQERKVLWGTKRSSRYLWLDTTKASAGVSQNRSEYIDGVEWIGPDMS